MRRFVKDSLIALLLLTLLITTKSYAAHTSSIASRDSKRIGLSFGGVWPWFGAVGISYDQMGVIPERNWSFGVEIGGLGWGLVVEPRAFYWQNANLSGFYLGPKASVGFFNNHYYHHHYDHHDDHCYNDRYDGDSCSSVLVGIGAEGGWLYRFPQRFDMGAGLEVKATNYGLWAGAKLMVGYLL